MSRGHRFEHAVIVYSKHLLETFNFLALFYYFCDAIPFKETNLTICLQIARFMVALPVEATIFRCLKSRPLAHQTENTPKP